MTDTTSTNPLAAVLTELGWKPEALAQRLNSFATLQGRTEQLHPKTPYKWLKGDQPLVGRRRTGISSPSAELDPLCSESAKWSQMAVAGTP